MDKLLTKLDQTITGVFSAWDIYSTTIFTGLIAFVAYQVITSRDPDAHPMLLARQSQASPVRHQGQSAIFRSHSAPHGMPLNSGLNVKDPGDAKWVMGRNGDLRDIWRKVVTGTVDRDGKDTGQLGEIMTVLGSEHVNKHKLADITRMINLLGQHIKQNGGARVAIYLPNSVEFLAAVFAGSFYDLDTILLPYGESSEMLIDWLQQSKPDTLIAAVGSLQLGEVTSSYKILKQMIWVVDEGSAHMDWNEIPSGIGGAINVSTWQDIIHDKGPEDGAKIPPVETSEPKKIIAFWPPGQMVEYPQATLIAGVAGQLSSIPSTQRFTNTDLFLPVDSLSTMYSLVLTLSALYSNASVVLNSVAGKAPDLTLATQGVTPTIIVASASTLEKVHEETKKKLLSTLYNYVHWFQTRTLVQNGVMPIATMFSRAYDSLRPIIGITRGKLRLIYVSEQAGASSSPLSAEMLSDLRIYTGARIIYALTAANVAGPITQTGLYDYRVDQGTEKYSHFGSPVTSVEVLFRDTNEHKTTDSHAVGEIVARGPAVVLGEAALGVCGEMKPDGTLALL